MKRLIHAAMLSLLVLTACDPATAFAESGEIATVDGKKHGVKMIIDSRWPVGPGYRPIRIRMEQFPPGPTPSDRTFQVTILLGVYSGPLSGLAVSEEITLEQGQSFVEKTISVPCSTHLNSLGVSVEENGVRLEDLHYINGRAFDNSDDRRVNHVATLGVSSEEPTDGSIKPAELPTRWIDYSSLDIIVISFADAKLLATTHQERWQALCRWLASGATLRILGDADSPERRAEIDALLRSSAGKDEPDADVSSPNQTSAWKEIAVNRDDIVDPDSIFAEIETKPTLPETSDKSAAMVERSFGMGTVQYSISAQQILHKPLDEAASWTGRHGIRSNWASDDFFRHQIPGVGLPPVTAFRILITLFVIVIGPVNYLILRRYRRLTLLFLTVPLASLIVVASLLAFALISDGLGVRARVRSLTQIDQQTGEMVCWSRQTYHASIAPADGLTFPGDTTVYPIAAPKDQKNGVWTSQIQERHIDWRGNQQHFRSGFIRSRTTAQFLVTSSRKTKRRLIVHSSSGSKDALTITNQLGCSIQRLLVCDEKGTLHTGVEIAANWKGKLTATTWASVSSIWKQEYRRNLPGRQLRKRPGPYRGILSRGIAAAMHADRALMPRSYVAIVSTSPEVNLGIEKAVEESSFHLITGSW